MANTIDFKVRILNLPALQRALAEYPAIAGPIIQKALAATQAYLAKAKAVANIPRRTNFLFQNWTFRSDSLRAAYSPTMFYAPYVEFGTGIYGPQGSPILPKEKKALYWPGAEHPYRSVKGQHPNPFIERMIEAAQPDISQLFVHALDNITQAIANQAHG